MKKKKRARGTTPSPFAPTIVCVFPAPLCPYAMTAPCMPRVTSSSVGSRYANTSAFSRAPSKTSSNAKTCRAGDDDDDGGGERSDTDAPSTEMTSPPPRDASAGRTRQTTFTPEEGAAGDGGMRRNAPARARLRGGRGKLAPGRKHLHGSTFKVRKYNVVRK